MNTLIKDIEKILNTIDFNFEDLNNGDECIHNVGELMFKFNKGLRSERPTINIYCNDRMYIRIELTNNKVSIIGDLFVMVCNNNDVCNAMRYGSIDTASLTSDMKFQYETLFTYGMYNSLEIICNIQKEYLYFNDITFNGFFIITDTFNEFVEQIKCTLQLIETS